MCTSYRDDLVCLGAELLHGRFEVTEKFAEDRKTHLYRAVDRETGQRVVAKFARPELKDVAAQFQRLGELLMNLSHPHLVKVFGAGRHNGLPYLLVQDMARGMLLERRPSGQEAISWLRPAAEALDYIHASGLIHREVRPGNIFFDHNDVVYVGESGIAEAMPDESGSVAQLASTLVDYLSSRALAGRQAAYRVRELVDRTHFVSCTEFAACVEDVVNSTSVGALIG